VVSHGGEAVVLPETQPGFGAGTRHPVSAGGSWSADDAGMMIEGTTSYDYFGEGQVSLGDHNGDGADDMFFGQEDYGSGEGAIYVFNQSGI
jgi:hypothetical protein